MFKTKKPTNKLQSNKADNLACCLSWGADARRLGVNGGGICVVWRKISLCVCVVRG